MFTIRSIDPAELAAWAALDDRPDGYLGRQMASFVERGSTRPEWCFLAEDGGRAEQMLELVEAASERLEFCGGEHSGVRSVN